MLGLKRSLSVFMLLVIILTGCNGKSDDKSVKVNSLKNSVTLCNVNFYDFYSLKKYNNYSGIFSAVGGTLASKSITCMDKKGKVRIICVSKELTKKPKNVRIYINRAKTKYNTYKCVY